MQISKIKEKNAWPHRATVPPSGTVKRSRIHRAQTSCVIHHHQWGIFGRHRFHSLTPLSRLPRISFLLWKPGQLAMSDPILSPEFEPKLAFKLTRTAQPTCLCVPLSRGQMLHPSSPKGTGSQPHWTALRPCSPRKRACGALPRRYERGHGKEKKYLGEAPRSSLSRAQEAHTPSRGGWREGVGVSERDSNRTGRARSGSACPSFGSHPPARRPEEKCFALALRTHHTHRGWDAPRRRSLHTASWAPRRPRWRWRPHCPPVGTNRRTVCLPMRSPGITHNPGAGAAHAHTPRAACGCKRHPGHKELLRMPSS